MPSGTQYHRVIGRSQSGSRAAHRDLVDTDGRLPHADGNALTLLAAGSDAGVELRVIADERDAGKRIRAAADQHGAFHCCADFPILDLVGFGAREDEFSAGDVDLAAAEIY